MADGHAQAARQRMPPRETASDSSSASRAADLFSNAMVKRATKFFSPLSVYHCAAKNG